MEEKDPATEEVTAVSTKKKRGKKRLLTILGIVAAVLIVAGVGGWKWHEQPSFCGTVCHKVMAEYVDTWEQDGLLANSHADADVVCLDCHEPTLSEQVAEVATYVKGEYTTPLKQVTFEDDFCYRCHEDRETLIAATANYATDAGITINPHERKVNKANFDDPHGEDATYPPCATCHSMHDDSPGIEYCFSCHHAENFDPCTTCHEGGM